MYRKKQYIGFGSIHGFRHPLDTVDQDRVLDCIRHRKGEATVSVNTFLCLKVPFNTQN